MKTIITSLVFVVGINLWFFTFFTGVAHAELTDQEIAAGIESCFAYYDYGKVSVNLATEQASYTTGQTAIVHGTITNENTFPLVDITVYGQLRRTNDTETFSDNGHHLVGRFSFAQKLNFLPGETKSFTADLPIVAGYPTGSYRLRYFIFSSSGFHYAGRAFLEEDFAGESLFDISGKTNPMVYFDINSLSVNGTSHTLRELITEYPEEQLEIEASLIDGREQKEDIAATVRYYSFEDSLEEQLVSTQHVTISKDTGKLQTTFRPPNSGAYVMVASLPNQHPSELKYRFAKKGTPGQRLRINDLGITNYPLTAKDRGYVCFHSPSRDKAFPSTLTLSLLNDQKQVIAEKTVTDQFDGAVRAISIPVEKAVSLSTYWLKAQLVWQDGNSRQHVKQWEIRYGCDQFTDSQTSLSSEYKPDTVSLSLQSLNACGDPMRTGGYVKSIKIKSEDGTVQKELYSEPVGQRDLSMQDLPPGNYVAEVTNDDITNTVSFSVAGASTTKASWLRTLVLWILAALVAIVLGYIWYRKHKQQKKDTI